MQTAIYDHETDDGEKVEYAVEFVVHRAEPDVGLRRNWPEICSIYENDAHGRDITREIPKALYEDIEVWLQEEGMW